VDGPLVNSLASLTFGHSAAKLTAKTRNGFNDRTLVNAIHACMK